MTTINNLFVTNEPYTLGYANAPTGDVMAINPTNTGIAPIAQPSSLGALTPVDGVISIQNGTQINCQAYFIQNTHVSCSVFLDLLNSGTLLQGAQTPGANELGLITIAFSLNANPQIPMPAGGSAVLNTVPGAIDEPGGVYLMSMHIEYNILVQQGFAIVGDLIFTTLQTQPSAVPANNPFSFGTCYYDDAPRIVYLGDYAVKPL